VPLKLPPRPLHPRTQHLEAAKIEIEERARVLKAVETGSEPPPESRTVLDQLEALGYVED